MYSEKKQYARAATVNQRPAAGYHAETILLLLKIQAER